MSLNNISELQLLISIDDAKACASMMASLEPYITLNRDYDDCLKIFLDRANDVYVVKHESRLVAFAVVRPDGPFTPYLRSLGVDAAYQNKGLGTRLVQLIQEKYGQTNRYMFICASSFNRRAQDLYERLGYEVVGDLPDYLLAGHSEILMMKKLPMRKNEPIPFLSANRDHMDIDFIHEQLTSSYWAKGITREQVLTRIMNSICFGVFLENRQIGFARVVTDFNAIAYLADVFIEEKERGKGYSKQLMKFIMEYPSLINTRWLLATRDAHGLYKQFGFSAVPNPERFMGTSGWRAFDVNREP